MFRPTLEEAMEIVQEGKYKAVPVSCEMYADMKTPIEVLRILKGVSKHCYMLESVEDNRNHGRYTFIGFEPVLGMSCLDGKLTIESGTTIQLETKHPGEYIKQLVLENKSPRLPYLPSFTGGLVGYFSYDYIKYAEPGLKLDAKDEEHFKDVDIRNPVGLVK